MFAIVIVAIGMSAGSGVLLLTIYVLILIEFGTGRAVPVGIIVPVHVVVVATDLLRLPGDELGHNLKHQVDVALASARHAIVATIVVRSRHLILEALLEGDITVITREVKFQVHVVGINKRCFRIIVGIDNLGKLCSNSCVDPITRSSRQCQIDILEV